MTWTQFNLFFLAQLKPGGAPQMMKENSSARIVMYERLTCVIQFGINCIENFISFRSLFEMAGQAFFAIEMPTFTVKWYLFAAAAAGKNRIYFMSGDGLFSPLSTHFICLCSFAVVVVVSAHCTMEMEWNINEIIYCMVIKCRAAFCAAATAIVGVTVVKRELFVLFPFGNNTKTTKSNRNDAIGGPQHKQKTKIEMHSLLPFVRDYVAEYKSRRKRYKNDL